MAFRVMYYLCLTCPTVEDTLTKIDEYVERGADFLQIDMPSSDPFAESDFIKEMMKNGLAQNSSYDYYMDVLRSVRKKHPDIDLSVVVYTDVVETIGYRKYLDFLKEIGAKNNMIAGDLPEFRKMMDEEGVTYFRGFSYSDPEYDLEELMKLNLTEEDIVCTRTRRRVESINRRYDTWEKRIALAKSYGLKAKIYAVAEIETKEDMLERKNAGCDGAIIGNKLMRLWNEPDKLWKLFDEFQSCVEK